MSRAKVPEHLPAKSLEDIQLDEKVYAADFELSARFDQLAKELERLALLGIGVYGLFISKPEWSPDAPLAHHWILPAVGLGAFGVSAGCALICTHWNSKCLKLQVDILRLLGRMESGRWTLPDEQEVNGHDLRVKRADQKRMLMRGKALISLAVMALITGAAATVVCFILTLFQRVHPTAVKLPG